jgi:hypothetical protein
MEIRKNGQGSKSWQRIGKLAKELQDKRFEIGLFRLFYAVCQRFPIFTEYRMETIWKNLTKLHA